MRPTVDEGLPADTPGDFAARMAEGLRRVGETARQLAPAVIDATVALAYLGADDPRSARARKRARAMLARNGWVTAHEFETLPEATVRAVALERFLAGNGRA